MDALQTTFSESDQKKIRTSKKFRNNSHSVRILEDLQSLRKNYVLCDVRLKADDGKIVIGHKNLLVAASPYFSGMFSDFDNKDIVNIKEFNSTILQQLVDYIYTGEIMVSKENVQALLPASNILQLDYVKDACAEFLKTQLDPTNCLGIRELADLHYCMELLLSSEAFIKKQFIEVVKCDEFKSLPYEAVLKLISSNDLTVPFEEKVYESIIDWVNHELDRRIEFLPGLMEHVRLPLAPVEYILNKVVEDPLIKNSSGCNTYVVEALHFHLHKTNPHITIPQTIRCSPRLQNVKVILVLSTNNRNICINCYDPTTDKWEIAPEIMITHLPDSLWIIKDQFLFAVGRDSSSRCSWSVSMLDLTSQSPIWVPTVDMIVSRSECGVAVLDDCIYAVGGEGSDDDDDDDTALNSVEVYNLSIKKWRMVSSMTIKRYDMGIGVFNNRIYAIGGYGGSKSLKSVEYYDASLNKWTKVADMSVDRYGFGVGVLDGVIYAIGGKSNGLGELKSVEAYKPSDGAWTTVADMHRRRAYAGVVAFDGLLYVMGGIKEFGRAACKSFEIYNPKTNTWKIECIDSNSVGEIFAAAVFNRPPYLRFN